MNKIAKKIFLAILFSATLAFAIGLFLPEASAHEKRVILKEPLIHALNSEEFWSKFRDSVMKDKDDPGEHKPPQSPPPPEKNPPKK